MNQRLKGRVAIVTGAAKGLGQAYAVRLAQDGADIALGDVADASETEALIKETGRRSVKLKVDVSSPDSVRQCAADVQKDFGRCDILINNAGIYPYQSFEEMKFEDWRRVLTVNLDGAFLMCKAFVPLMKPNKHGRIVNITSAECWMVAANNLHHIAAKMGVIGLTRALATEVAEFGITVNCVAPGLTGTATVKETAAEYTKTMPQMQAIKRLGMPADLAGAISFLSSDDAAFITGQTLIVDGGLVRL